MSEPNEQDEANEADEPAGEPVTGAAADDDEAADEDAREQERAASEAEGAAEGDDDAPQNVGTSASAKAARDEQKQIEKMFASFDKEAERHNNRVSEIGGEAAQDLLACPMCTPDEGQPRIPGWLLPVAPSESKIANVRAAIGLAPKIDYREDPHSKVCQTCGGLKSVLPAGGDATTPLLPCADCKSQGWVPTDEVRGGAGTNGTNAQNVTATFTEPATLEQDMPQVAALKAAGYTVIAPYRDPVGA